MNRDAEDQARRDAEMHAARANTTEGIVLAVSYTNRLVTVIMGGFSQDMPWRGPVPWIGDRVRVDMAGGIAVAASIYGAPYGTVLAQDGLYLKVAGDDGVEYRYPTLTSTTGYTGGMRVALDHALRVVLGRLSIDPAFEKPIDQPDQGAVTRSGWFTPIWSGNWSNGSFSGDAATISSSRVGAYGYGTAIADTIADGAAILRAELHLVQNWDNVPGTASSMGTHTFNGRPGSMVNANLTGTYSVAGGSYAVDIRGEVIGRLMNGTAYGVAFRSGSTGWREYASAPGSGRVFVEWRT